MTVDELIELEHRAPRRPIEQCAQLRRRRVDLTTLIRVLRGVRFDVRPDPVRDLRA